MFTSTVFDTMPRHTRCGLENSAVRPGTGFGMSVAFFSFTEHFNTQCKLGAENFFFDENRIRQREWKHIGKPHKGRD
jgi:hypothetical protein